MPSPYDATVVCAWLAELGLAPTGELTFDEIGAGQSNLTYRVGDASGRAWVLRRPPLGRVLESAHDVLREARIMTALQPTAVPVPQVHGTLADPPTVLMSCVEGVVLGDEEAVRATPSAARRTIGRSLIRTLDAVHAVDLDSTGLGTLASREPYAPRQLRRWERQWQACRTRELPALEALTARLAAADVSQHETTLVHGDCHLLNVITAPDTGAVVALLDWELSTLGEPLADLGTLLTYWPQPGEPSIQHFAPSRCEGFATRDDLIQEYAVATGRDVSSAGFWHAVGVWKVAIIAEGVVHRSNERQADDESVHLLRERIDALIDHGHELAAAAGI